LINETDQIRTEHEEKRMPTPLAASVIYLTVLVLMLLTSFLQKGNFLEGDNFYITMFLIQIVTIGLPPIVYLIYNKIDIRKAARLNRISIPEILLSIGMALFGYGVIIFLNLLWVLFLSKFGTPQTQRLPAIETGPHYLMSIVVIAVLPALLEEFMFRGVIQRGYERFGKTASIVLTGILFAFLHVSIVSIPAIIFMGILLCYITYRANTLWAGAVYHFTNNLIAVTLLYISGVLTKLFPMEGAPDSLPDIPPETLNMAVLAWGFIGSVALILFVACFAGFHIVTRGKQKVIAKDMGKTTGQKMLQFLPAVVAVIVIIVLLAFEVVQMVSPTPIMQIIRYII
jgi:membrane protease YdiL (CAAX protease family)